MKDKSKQLVAALIAMRLMESALAADGNLIEHSFARAWRRASTVDYAAPATDDLSAMTSAFGRLLKGERGEDLKKDLRRRGWTLRSEEVNGVLWTVLAEEEDQRSGRGMYAFSIDGSHARHALQAPHVPSDGLTGDILLRFAEDGLPRALAWNTVPRTKADMAHMDGTYFIAFSRAYAEAYPNEKIIQLHGFENSRRRSSAGRESGAIVSATHKNPSRELRASVQCLKERFDAATGLYGQDVAELGGTTNSIARTLRNEGFDGLIHVELSLPLREVLAEDAVRRRVLYECLGGR